MNSAVMTAIAARSLLLVRYCLFVLDRLLITCLLILLHA